MATVSVPHSFRLTYPATRQDFATAQRRDVPIVRKFRGLAVTPSIGHRGFTVTHLGTGLAVPSLSGLSFDAALLIADLLSRCLAWEAVDDIFFFRALPPHHQDALNGCILAAREMFGAGEAE